VAVQVTVVIPIGNVLPEAGVHMIVGVESHVSLAMGVNITVAPDGLVHSWVMLDGQVIDGGVVSTTCTVNMQLEGDPTPLLAVQVTVVIPIGKVLPDAGLHITIGTGHPVAVGVLKVTTLPDGLVHSSGPMFAGQAPIRGGCSMVIVTVCVPLSTVADAIVLFGLGHTAGAV
jgi:hypothetical protein